MQTKLTIRINDHLIFRAKAYAREKGKSLSQLVADYFAILDNAGTADINNLPPITRELSGALANKHVDEADYRDHLAEKYR